MESSQNLYFEKVNSIQNMSRWYRLSIVRTLFGEWSMVREWGRIGQRGQSREHWCATQEEASAMLAAQRALRLRRGYR